MSHSAAFQQGRASLWIAFILFLLPTVLLPQFGPMDRHLEQRVQPIRINGGSEYRMPIAVDSPGKLTGQVKAQGGSGHDIRIQVFRGDRLMFDSGQRHLIDIDLSLPEPGEYWVIFDNSFSVFSQKLVWHDLNAFSAKPSQPSAAAPPPLIPVWPKSAPSASASPEPERDDPRKVLMRLRSQSSRTPRVGDGPAPDRWRGLILSQSAPDDAIHVLGPPHIDELDRAEIQHFSTLARPIQREKVFRKLGYRNLEGFHEVNLLFWEDKLVLIDLTPQSPIPARNLSQIYGTEFVPFNTNELTLTPDQRVQERSFSQLGSYDGHLVSASARIEAGGTVDKGQVFRLQLVSSLLIEQALDQPRGSDLLR